MKMNPIVACLAFFCISGGVAAHDIHGQDSTKQLLKKAEVRLRSIYETKEYGGEARSFRGTWLPDGSGYTVTETDPDSNRRVQVRYDAATDGTTPGPSPSPGTWKGVTGRIARSCTARAH